ncbi:DegV family protein [Mycoplasma nasistruthionis]|uniref:DegV family EDD domain-containing protein n=1 Tax=Mycoplasma nasistruthionis TaxID=353852 RepID=A0A4Y6I5M2_9MOLU|nr:DegV family protein [Mycoplasma nasistruthionis]QCZ36617.1 DegV family EDD domain-containing protein [Mycoplasma nasistruthionis]QDF64914.1 DegV family EDD domain-containing protein [Mycoplasma nasistruthionis]
MKKLGIILDSFSGLSKAQAQELEFGFLPLQVEIDGKIYQDGIDDNLEILTKIQDAKSILTSSPKLELIQSTIAEFASQYENVIYLGISSKLSSTLSHAANLALEHDNVYVVDNHFVGTQLVNAALYALRLSNNGMSVGEILQKLNKLNNESTTYLVPKTMEYLIKGGRISGVKKFILTKLSVLPVLEFSADGSVGSIGLKRTLAGAIAKATEKVMSFNENEQMEYHLIKGIDQQVNQLIDKTASEYGLVFADSKTTPAAIAIHTGPEAFAFSTMPKLELK